MNTSSRILCAAASSVVSHNYAQKARHATSLAALAAVGLLAAAQPARAEEPADVAVGHVAARVGDEVVTSIELDRVLAPITRELSAKFGKEDLPAQIAGARRAALLQLVDRKLLAIEAKAMEIQIPSVEVDKQIDRFRADYATDEDFQGFLDEQRLTRDELRKMVEEDLKVKVLFHEKVYRRARVSPSEIHDYYQLHVSEFLQPAQILNLYTIMVKKKPDHVQALQRAKDILAELKAGANFQQTARLKSEGAHKAEGGDWGKVTEGDFSGDMAEVEKTAFALKQGQVSAIVEGKDGYYMAYMVAKYPSKILTEEEAYDQVYNRLFQVKLAEIYEDYMQHLRDKTYVEVLDETVGELPGRSGTLPVAPLLPKATSGGN